MSSFSFKSSGKTQEQRQIEQLTQSQVPFGIKTPLRLGTEDFLETNFNLADQVQDNLRNLLLTNWGERLGFYNFGGNLRPLVTELVSLGDFDTAAVERIREAVNRWMSYVDLEDFSSETDRIENKNTAVIRITITYNVPALNIKKKQLQITLYAL